MTPDAPLNDDPIFHLAMPRAWADAFVSGEYLVSTRDMSLDEVGFIHCSTREQIESTANNFYDDVDQLVVLTIDPLLVPSRIVFEAPARDSPLLFPHIYGPLPVSAVNLASPWTRSSVSWSLSTLRHPQATTKSISVASAICANPSPLGIRSLDHATS